jgi:hypothetical protein
LEGGVFEEADFDSYGDDLAEVGGGGEVFAPGAEVSEAEVPGAGEFEAGADDGGVEIDDRAELDFDAELHGGRGEGFAVEDPAAAVGEGGCERGEKALAFFVTEALDVERLHEGRASRVGWLPLGCSSENEGEGVRGGDRYCGHVTGRLSCCNEWFCEYRLLKSRLFGTDCVPLAGQM